VESGTGLGLATVQSIVQQWGGRVSVQSELGGGTVFTITMPVARTAEWQAASASVPPTTPRELPRTAIVCDDDAQVRRVLQKALQRHHIAVRMAESPAAALALAAEQPPDLLITDVVTGDGGGVALARHMREQNPSLPVLFVTGYISDETARAAIAIPGTDVLRKPFRVSELLEAMGRVMAASH
jgi:CheY-like chemotaxis protein